MEEKNNDGYFSVIGDLLRHPRKTIENIKGKINLRRYFIGSNLIILVCSAIYGLAIGFYPKDFQILYDLIKIPILLLITVYISIPVFYIIGALSGSEVNISQISTVLLTSFAVMSVVMATFAPAVLLFTTTTTDYTFIVLLNIMVCGFAGLCAIGYLYRSYKGIHETKRWRASLLIGCIVLMFAGTQLSWVLRPYFTKYPQFIKPLGGNFYVAVADIAVKEPMLVSTFVLVFLLIGVLLLLAFIGRGREVPKEGSVAPSEAMAIPEKTITIPTPVVEEKPSESPEQPPP